MPPRETETASAEAVLPVRMTVKAIGFEPASPPEGSVTVTVMVGSVGAAGLIVTVWVRTLWLPKTSVAVQVMVVVPMANRLPAGTPSRVTTTPGTLSVAVAVPIVLSLRYTVDDPLLAVRVMSAGTVRVGGTRSGEW